MFLRQPKYHQAPNGYEIKETTPSWREGGSYFEIVKFNGHREIIFAGNFMSFNEAWDWAEKNPDRGARASKRGIVMNKVKGSIQVVEQEEMEELIGNKVYACEVCGLIAIADKDEDIKEVDCVECGNRDWKLLGKLASAVEEEVDEDGNPTDEMNDEYGKNWIEGEEEIEEETEIVDEGVDTDKGISDIFDDDERF